MMKTPHECVRLSALLFVVAIAPSCQWASTHGRPGDAGMSDTTMSTAAGARSSKMEGAQALHLEIARMDAEIARQSAVNVALREELAAARADLDQVEKQFVIFERRLVREETKASSVAAVAEVRLVFDRARASKDTPLDAATMADVEAKLAQADDLVRKHNYSAAVYYANRSLRILNRSERSSVITSDAYSFVISVDKANLRGGPGAGFEIMEKLDYGTPLVQLEARDEWYRVKTGTGRLGWVHRTVIR